MRPEMLMSLILLEAIKKEEQNATIKSVSNLLKKIKDSGIKLAGINFKTRPGGYYSEDLERYVGQLLIWDFAQQSSPIKLTKKGHRLLEENISQFNEKDPGTVSKVKEIVNLIYSKASY